MRVFIGFFVPENIKNCVVGVQSNLEKLPMRCKMVEPHNIHACLSFLGDMGNDKVAKIQRSLSEICESRPKFEAGVGGIKIIPNEKYIRVIVLEILDPSGALEAVCSAIKESVGGSMKPPHLTLCRVRSVSDKEGVVEGIKALEARDDLKFVVDKVSLIKSELSRAGPEYSVVHEATFASSSVS